MECISSCLEALKSWASFSEQFWWDAPDRPGVGCFGTGYANWGVQTNQKYLGAMAVLGGLDEDWESGGFTRAKALERAVAALRFSLASHLTGDYHCTDGTQWGRHWISPLGVERMMHGVELVWDSLEDADRRRMLEVLADEADHQCSAEVVAGLWARERRNKPESNIWNGAVCARAAMMMPDHPNVARWAERAHLCLVNGISVPADADDETIIAGRSVSARHVGANFFPNYALDHHGYLNTGYMVICLSNVAMLHYSCVLRGAEVPESLYHHARDLWALVKRLISPGGRLLRIGGDTRIRYCYCQDYLLPTLVMAADLWGDAHAAALLEGAVGLIRHEQSTNEDGSFLSGRLGEIRRRSPYYYTRLESDKAVVLSQAAHWLARRGIAAGSLEGLEESVAGGWEEPEHGAVMHRSAGRLASWSWRAAEPPQGLCLPPADGDMAEWMENLAGSVRHLGTGGTRELVSQAVRSFDGGFLTWGEVTDGAGVQLAEGWRAESTARHLIAFAALPDGRTCLRLEHAVTDPRRAYLAEVAGVKLEMPNDIFNGGSRRYFAESGEVELASHLGVPEEVETHSRWINVDDRLGLVAAWGGDWSMLRRGERSGGHAFGNVITDAVCLQLSAGTGDIPGDTAVLDNGCVILSGATAAQTSAYAAEGLARRPESRGEVPVRVLIARGADGREYALALNFAREQVAAEIGDAGAWRDVATGGAVTTEDLLMPGEARLLVGS